MDALAVRDLYVLSFSFLLLFLAFSSCQNLESSLGDAELGTAALGTIYLSFTVFCLAAPRLLAVLGVARAVPIAMSTYALFVAAHLVPSWVTLLGSGALLGVGAAVLWAAQGAYLASLAPSNKSEAAQASGTFFAIYQCSQILGNLIAFAILRAGAGGAQDVPLGTRQLLFGCYLASACCGVLLATRLTDRSTSSSGGDAAVVPPTEEPVFGARRPSAGSEAGGAEPDASAEPLQASPDDTMLNALCRDRKLLALLPLFFFSGAQAAFVWGSFTASVIKPLFGQAGVPLAMALYGFVDACCSWALGRAVAARPRLSRPLLSLGCALEVLAAIYVGALFDPDRTGEAAKWLVVIMLALVFGFADASQNTIITALIASMYDGPRVNVPFAHFRLWQSLATAISFFYSSQASLTTKSIVTALTGSAAVIAAWLS